MCKYKDSDLDKQVVSLSVQQNSIVNVILVKHEEDMNNETLLKKI